MTPRYTLGTLIEFDLEDFTNIGVIEAIILETTGYSYRLKKTGTTRETLIISEACITNSFTPVKTRTRRTRTRTMTAHTNANGTTHAQEISG